MMGIFKCVTHVVFWPKTQLWIWGVRLLEIGPLNQIGPRLLGT